MTGKLRYIIEQAIEEQWSSLTSSHFFGKDRETIGGSQEPDESPIWNQQEVKAVEYRNKLRDLEPILKQSQQYGSFLQELGNTNPNDEASLFRMYENFLHYFSINKENFQDGDEDDWAAASAVAEYFKSHPDRLR